VQANVVPSQFKASKCGLFVAEIITAV